MTCSSHKRIAPNNAVGYPSMHCHYENIVHLKCLQIQCYIKQVRTSTRTIICQNETSAQAWAWTLGALWQIIILIYDCGEYVGMTSPRWTVKWCFSPRQLVLEILDSSLGRVARRCQPGSRKRNSHGGEFREGNDRSYITWVGTHLFNALSWLLYFGNTCFNSIE